MKVDTDVTGHVDRVDPENDVMKIPLNSVDFFQKPIIPIYP
jgi:hypothetical protein